MKTLICMSAAVLVLSAAPGAAKAAAKATPGNGTWHIGLVELWGKDRRGSGRNLDIAPLCPFKSKCRSSPEW